jgi:transposase
VLFLKIRRENNMEEKQRRKRFDDDFKISAVKMVLEGGRTITSVASDIGINPNTLQNWKKKYLSKDGKTITYNGKEYFGNPEIVALKKELASVKYTPRRPLPCGNGFCQNQPDCENKTC